MEATLRTYHDFLRRICQWGALTEWEAEEAASSILNAIENRLGIDDYREIPAWVPAGLRSVLASCPRHEHDVPSSFARVTLTQLVAEDLGLNDEAADAVVHAVFAAARTLVSAPEASTISEQLPDDLRALWERPVFDRALGQTPISETFEERSEQFERGGKNAGEENVGQGRTR